MSTLVDLADEAEIDLVAGAVGGARDLGRGDHASVLAAQADGAAAFGVDEADDLLVDRAGEHHFDDVHRGSVGHAQAVRKLRG